MGKWIACGASFITGDVIRWVEPIWKQRTRKTERGRQIGARIVTAQVLRCDEGWACLMVEPGGCVLQPFDGYQGVVGKEHQLEGEIRRRRGPIGQGEAHRALWSDESARAVVASRFFRGEPDAVPQPPPRPWRLPHPDAGKRGGRAGRYRGRGAGKRGPRLRPRSR